MDNINNRHAARIEQLRTTRTETENVILRRRSVRLYKKEQVPEFMVNRILEAGRFAPTAGNGQPWKFLVIREPEIIDGLTRTTIHHAGKLKSLLDYRIPGRRWLLPLAKLFIRLKPKELHPIPFSALRALSDGDIGLFHGAPTVVIILKDVRGISNPDLDCGITGQNMVLAAHSMGLGTCWVSFAKLAFQQESTWRKRLKVEYPYTFASSLAIGWPVGEPDGMIPRPTHAIDWYENGTCKVVY